MPLVRSDLKATMEFTGLSDPRHMLASFIFGQSSDLSWAVSAKRASMTAACAEILIDVPTFDAEDLLKQIGIFQEVVEPSSAIQSSRLQREKFSPDSAARSPA